MLNRMFLAATLTVSVFGFAGMASAQEHSQARPEPQKIAPQHERSVDLSNRTYVCDFDTGRCHDVASDQPTTAETYRQAPKHVFVAKHDARWMKDHGWFPAARIPAYNKDGSRMVINGRPVFRTDWRCHGIQQPDGACLHTKGAPAPHGAASQPQQAEADEGV